jgi:hypothetical protein
VRLECYSSSDHRAWRDGKAESIAVLNFLMVIAIGVHTNGSMTSD